MVDTLTVEELDHLRKYQIYFGVEKYLMEEKSYGDA